MNTGNYFNNSFLSSDAELLARNMIVKRCTGQFKLVASSKVFAALRMQGAFKISKYT